MVCANCGAAVSIREQGLSLLDVYYVASSEEKADRWPFWRFPGQVWLDKRETQGGDRSGAKHAKEFWSTPRQFYLPAWELEWKEAKRLGMELLAEQPRFQTTDMVGDGRFRSATVAPEDAEKLLRLVVLSIEAARGDWLEDISFRLQLDAAELWAIPARLTNSGWRLQAKVEKR
jgi:hypothetical protein